jgi:hypothetical protein
MVVRTSRLFSMKREQADCPPCSVDRETMPASASDRKGSFDFSRSEDRQTDASIASTGILILLHLGQSDWVLL